MYLLFQAANGEEPDLRDSMEASISQSEAEEPQQDVSRVCLHGLSSRKMCVGAL